MHYLFAGEKAPMNTAIVKSCKTTENDDPWLFSRDDAIIQIGTIVLFGRNNTNLVVDEDNVDSVSEWFDALGEAELETVLVADLETLEIYFPKVDYYADDQVEPTSVVVI